MPIISGASSGSGGGGITQIATSTLGSAGTFNFASIGSTFTSLLLLGTLRSSRAAGGDSIILQFNGDTGSNYADDLQLITTTQTILERNTTTSIGGNISIEASTAPAGNASAIEIWIPNYAQTTFKKQCVIRIADFGGLTTGTHGIQHVFGYWNSTAAITSILVTPTNAPTTFVTGSVLTLYGIT